MKLFLHAGTEKTGSSFLQMLAARNRETLLNSGIHFPSGGKREKDMLAGRVSPGNGKSLHDALKRKSAQTVHALLTSMVADAAALKCDAILISNENLVELYAIEGAFELLEKTCRETGVREIHGLLILRDPVDQALSLYKHRAKSGSVSPVAHWIKHEFYTLDVLQRFLELKDDTGITWTLKKYEKAPRKMNEIFFAEWLNVKHPVAHSDTIVNPSLTLSELLVLKNQYIVNPAVVPYCYQALLDLSPGVKAGDKVLETAYRTLMAENLLSYQETINQLNGLIDDGNALVLPEKESPDEALSDNIVLSLSEQQVACILHAQLNYFSVAGQTSRIIDALKRRIVRLLR